MMIRVGVIGAGRWGPNHVRVLSSVPDCIVSGVFDTAPVSIPGVTCFDSLDALLHESDAVVIATPTSTHYGLAMRCLIDGKHVLCEKPLCLKSAEGDELVAAARRNGRILMVGHVFLFNPGILKVKELVESGEIGTIRSITALRTNLGPIRSDVNVAWDLASHDIAVMNWLLNDIPCKVSAMGGSFVYEGIEDVMSVSMKYPAGTICSIQCSWLDPKKVRQLTVVGSRKMLTWDDLAISNPVTIYEKSVDTHRRVSDYGEFLRVSMYDGDVRLPHVNASEPLKVQDSEFISAIRSGRTPLSDGAFGADVVRVLERVGQSL